MKEVFGRTNEVFPSVWASLSVPDSGFGEFTPADLVSELRQVNVPIDISSQPALWGSVLRGGQDVLLQRGTLQIEKATSEEHATDLVQAHLIETLSAVGREMIDFYFLRIRRNLEEYQINGALAALEYGKQEGHIRFLGLQADGPAMAVLGFWQFHDGFDAVMIPHPAHSARTYDTLQPMAHQRRVGVLQTHVTELNGVPLAFLDAELESQLLRKRTAENSVLWSVSSPNDVKLISSAGTEVSDSFESRLESAKGKSLSSEFLDSIRGLRTPWAKKLREKMEGAT
jgi:hypothetical protein